jgi:dUTP pyrophosphatase
MQLQVQKLHPEAKIPAFAHDTDAGIDLFGIKKVTIVPGQMIQIQTGIALAIPEGYVGLMCL